MTRRKMAILLAIGLFSSPLAARDQSSRPESSSPVPTGVCRGVALYASSDLRAQPIGAGQHLLFFRRSVRLDIEMVGGGGGGGGANTGTDQRWGGGGGQSEIIRRQNFQLAPGYYLLRVGSGGAGGQGHGWRGPPVNGESGGDTVLVRCASGQDLDGTKARGGTGGRGNSQPTDHAERGKDLVDPQDGHVVGTGGAAGRWQPRSSGSDAQGFGSGGGGQGGTTRQSFHHGGRGADGYARLTRIAG